MSKRYIGFFTGILAFIIIMVLPAPEGLSHEGKSAAAVVILMSIWWITEAIPVFATAFLPLALYPVLEILPASKTAVNYGHNYVLMMLGGFFLGKAIESQNLHKRIALIIINIFGVSRRRIIFSMMVATAFLSMWIANVTAAVMMFPIALSIVSKEEEDLSGQKSTFATALMLGIAYSATLGGLGTLIGTPTNLIMIGILENLFPDAPPITFFTWLKVGLPLLIVLLPLFAYYLSRYFRVSGNLNGNETLIKDELSALGKTTPGERRVIYVCIFAIVGWVFRENLVLGDFVIPGWSELLGLQDFVHDSTVAMAASIMLFAIPATKEKRLLDWKQASQVPWGVVMIVGGGYAIAAGFESTGLADWLGAQLAFVSSYPFIVVLILVIGFVMIFTEFNSNTATANILLPVLASMAVAASMNPLLLMIPATVASSLGFMMPAGTGPNTVIFGSERVTVSDMVKCGVWLNLISLIVLTILMYFIIMPWLNFEPTLPAWAQ
ncbi:MAG TPA: SLC13 family permease [Cyclobacteriaceae bacterium]|nr:SLC13 family permease [Cyclobacteriaceae bacterium]HMV09952.1 SLC13 family permease [Cyclobacteriaceae bacterium]HMX01609.1 SLC13 family permease [Cyclobacteriaceae bacterium]HMX50697.1 SLC13 family permease [Cyclobacteriaceae bacterium]HMY91587.1 SLC13 family permease [Cyclobacteriaceae bacterium]